MQIIDGIEISDVEAKKIMEDRKKQGDMTYEQKICFEFLEKSVKMTQAQFNDLVDELKKIAILKPRYIALIINMMPDTEEEVEALFNKERTNLKKEEIKQIVDIIKQFKK
ncbi:MAG: hypothetical protein HZB67_04215 [Candidatus Aenigmarchaeota archaeon]|nr:hypothetical protein [Candidatus Aenigmarchaeota archaeon]